MRWVLTSFLVLCAAVAHAACPVQDFAALDAQREPIFQALKASKSEGEGQQLSDQIWSSWASAPDAEAQAMLDEGMRRIRVADFTGAEARLDALVAYCPEYPEGWNQRAFARYLQGNYDGSLEDLGRTLELEPRHFGALAGQGLNLLRQGRDALAQKALRAAVDLHPWMNERHLIVPAPGQKI